MKTKTGIQSRNGRFDRDGNSGRRQEHKLAPANDVAPGSSPGSRCCPVPTEAPILIDAEVEPAPPRL